MAQPDFLKLIANLNRTPANQTPLDPTEALLQEQELAKAQYEEQALAQELAQAKNMSVQPQGAESDYVPTDSGPVVTTQSEEEKAMMDYVARANAQNKKATDYAEQGLAGYEAALNAPQDTRVDLSPLLALSDTWFGGNLQKGYQAPPSPEEVRQLKNKNLLALADKKNEIAKLMASGDTNSFLAKLMLARKKDEGTQSRSDERKVSELSTRLEKSGLAGLEPVIDQINTTIPNDGDISGVGQTAFLPDFAVSTDGKNVRNAISSLRNIILNARSGQAVSESEANRMLEEIGMGSGRTDEQLRTGIRNVIKQLSAKKQAILAGYKSSVKDTFSTQGGDVSLPTIPFSKDKKKRLEELRAKRAKGTLK